MTTRNLLPAAMLALTTLAWTPATAQADSYVSYHCHCTAANEGDSCSCYYNFQLGKSQTKEFRGYCDGSLDESISVDQRDGGTSCTIQVKGFGGYISKSCTNWDPFSRDDVRIRVKCSNNPPEDDPI